MLYVNNTDTHKGKSKITEELPQNLQRKIYKPKRKNA